MKIHHIRNATMVIEAAGEKILVDPMLGGRGSMPPLTLFRHRPRRNPLVDLPEGTTELLEGVTAALITHCRFGHNDHLDAAGCRFLARRNPERRSIPVFCGVLDEPFLQRRGLETRALKPGFPLPALGGEIRAYGTAHGYGVVGWMMGPGLGYLLRLPGEPSLYLSGDTVLTDRVRSVLSTEAPDIAVVAAGAAQLDVGRPILMSLEQILDFVALVPGTVIANHMEALNHCPLSRRSLASAWAGEGDPARLWLPEDGQSRSFSKEMT